ncbi:MAG: hypothetical protein B6245_20920 [Desulfobacteraceae bacterium 4572_88]|nr:MAG: hypothetical protein B6245_20920 [Desulfobacteraceae bacterium 4572_88]
MITSEKISRRRFLKYSAGSGLILSAPFLSGKFGSDARAGLFPLSSSADELIRDAPVARYWISANAPDVSCLSCHTPDDKLRGNQYDHGKRIVKCELCAQECVITEGERGKCRARINVDGKLRTLVYGHPISVHVDPIEKKPFYHFLPGASAFSLATAGCPLTCKFCQNWEISQARPEDFRTQFVSPEAIVRATAKRSASVIAFTYNEPTVFTEYLTDIARIARKQDFRNVLISPTLNDSKAMLTELSKWVVGELGPDVPVHFTRFHPDYQMLNLPPTPVETLEQAYEIAKAEGIRYAFVGNVPGHPGNHTYCPACGKAVILRTGFFVTEQHLEDGCCEYCNARIAGVWV